MQNQNITTTKLDSPPRIIDPKLPFLLVIEKGKEVSAAIIACAEKHKIGSATLSGIGALENPELGYYNLETKQYQIKKFTGTYELISLIGNITKLNNNFAAHIHVALSNEKYQIIAGHLIKATVAVTAEISIIPFHYEIQRCFNPDFNVNLIEQKN